MLLGDLISDATYALGRFLCKNRRKKWAATLGQLVKGLYFSYENHNYNFSTNGELFLVKKLSQFDTKIVFDVGANIGTWSQIGLRHFEKAEFYIFEIIPDIFQILKSNLPDDKRINIFNIGLGEKSSVSFANYVQNKSSLSSLYSIEHPLPSIAKIEVSIEQLDSFCSINRVGEIDLLKIDTEGMDFQILQGASNLLREEKIKVIQFEYGYKSIETGFLLKDFYQTLNVCGYLVGKLYPNYVDFREYHRSMEDFIGPNFVAVHKRYSDIISALRND